MQKFITRPDRALAAKLAVVALVCLLTACSAIRLGYANGESVVYWWLDGYVDFQNDQSPWVRKHIANLFAWHRKTQLPDYARLLTQAQQRVQRPVTPADVLSDYTEIKKRALVVVERALPELTDLALSMTPDQIAHLERKFASNNDSYRKENLRGDLEYRQRFRFKKVMKQAEYWFGDFSPQQEAQIRAASDARPLSNEIWMTERLRRHEEMIGMLKKIHADKPGRDAAMAMLHRYAQASFENFTYGDNKEFFDATREGGAQMIATIINIATPAQRAHAVQRLQKLAEDCKSMAAQ
jgi:Family of unknown function (DUF6279)